MPDLRTIQSTFSGGEVSPKVLGRIDHDRYKGGASRLENIIVTPQGIAMKRSGTKAVDAFHAYDASGTAQTAINYEAGGSGTAGCNTNISIDGSTGEVKGVRLIPFVYNDTESYALVFISHSSTVSRCLVYDNNAKALIKWHSSDDGSPGKVSRGNYDADDYFVVGVSSSFLDGYNFSYSPTELDELDYAQVGNDIYIVHKYHPPIKITRWHANNVVAGYNSYRRWDVNLLAGAHTHMKATNRIFDGPYLPIGQGKVSSRLNSYPDSDPILTVKLIEDTTILQASHITDITSNHTPDDGSGTGTGGTLANNVYVEYEKNGKKYLGKIIYHNAAIGSGTAAQQLAVLDAERALGQLRVTTIDNVLEDIDAKVVLESNHATINSVTHVLSDSAIFSKNNEGYFFKHRQMVNDTNWESVARWVEIEKYEGSKVVKRSGSNPIMATWQSPETGGAGAGDYNSDPASEYTGGITVDVVQVSQITTVHFQSDYNHPDGTVTSKQLTAGGTLTELTRTITGELYCNKPVFASPLWNSGSPAALDSTRDYGRHFRVKLNDVWCYGQIGYMSNETSAVPANTAVGCSFDVPLPWRKDGKIQMHTTEWQLGAWYPAVTAGPDTINLPNFPSSVTFFQNRLVFGGGEYTPQSLWFSELGNYDFFGPTDLDGKVLDTSGISYAIASTEPSSIMWMSSGQDLLVGTTNNEWRVSSTEETTALSATNISIKQQTSFGSSSQSIVNIDGSIIFIQSPGKVIRELSYNYESNSYRSINLSIVAEHLFTTSDPVKEVVSVNFPDNYVLFRTMRGKLICVTFEKENKVVAATRLTLGGGTAFISAILREWVSATNDVSTVYSLGQVVVYNGHTYQCIKGHTASVSFTDDYLSHNWIHDGAGVLSMCSMPATNATEADQVLMATLRSTLYRRLTNDSSLPVWDHLEQHLCFEYLEPVGSPESESAGEGARPDSITPLDFQITTASSSVANGATMQLTNWSPLVWEKLLTVAAASSRGADGISSVLIGVRGGVNPSTIFNGYTSSPDYIIEILNDYLVDPNGTANPFIITDGSGVAGTQQSWTNSTGYAQLVKQVIGFDFPCVIETLPLDIAAEGGTTVGRVRRINEVSLILKDSASFSVADDTLLTGETSFTGTVTASLDLDYEERQKFAIVSTGAGRLTVLGYSPEVTFNR